MPRTDIAQRDANGAVRNPARFSQRVVDVILGELEAAPDVRKVLDPFAGVGGVHDLRVFGYETFGIELEPEWALQSPWNVCGNALSIPTARNWRDSYRRHWRSNDPLPMPPFDAIVTSPTYGNRMADRHNARDACSHCSGTGVAMGGTACRRCDGTGFSRRNTYTHCLGHDLSSGNTGSMQWGDEYRSFHTTVWALTLRVLRPHGLFVLNISDHIRQGRRQRVAGWHVGELQRLGLTVCDIIPVNTRRNRNGANATVRTDAELVVVMEKP